MATLINSDSVESGIIVGQIAEITANLADGRGGGSGAAGAVIECIVGATIPMVCGMFQGGTLQERLLFTLILTGACATIGDHNNPNSYAVSIEVSPATLREAFKTYQNITGIDVRPWLPKNMVDFAARPGISH